MNNNFFIIKFDFLFIQNIKDLKSLQCLSELYYSDEFKTKRRISPPFHFLIIVSLNLF